MMNSFRLTVVVDNKTRDRLCQEHGYSLHITTSGNKEILFDTGQSDVVVANAKQLGIDLKKLCAVVLSHGHYDHSGGISAVVAENASLVFYLHPDALQKRYNCSGGNAREIGMGMESKKIIMNHYVQRVHWLREPREICEGLYVTGPITRESLFEDVGGAFYLDAQAQQQDFLYDDLALWFVGLEGLVVCLGCCHAGLLNTLKQIMRYSGETRIDTIIGGMHLLNAGRNRLEQTVAALQEIKVKKIVACHCSGDEAVRFLRERLDCTVEMGYAGLSLSF